MHERPLALRALLTLAIITGAVALRFWLMPHDARPAFVTFSPAMVLCFLLCGPGPGLAATALCAGFTFYVVIPPFWSVWHKPSGEIATAFFVLSSLMVGLIIENVRIRERAVRRRMARQVAVLDSEMIGVATVKGRHIVSANRGLELLLGYGQGGMAGADVRKAYPDEASYRAVGEAAYPIMAAGGSYRAETLMLTSDGRRIWVDLTGRMVDAQSDESLWLFADISVRKQAERAAADAAVRYRLLAENANDMIATMAPDSTVLYVSPAVVHVLGYAPEEIVGRKTLSLTHPDDMATAVAFFDRLIAAGPDAPRQTYEFRAKHKDGRWAWMEGQPRVEFDGAGRPLRYQDIVRDINARKLAEAALRTSQSFLSRTSQVAGVGGWEYDLATETLTWSDETCRLHDLPAGHRATLSEGIGFYTPDARPIIAKAVQDGIEHGKSWDLELPIVSARGRAFWARAVGAVEFEGGRAVRLVGAFQDVTQLRQMARDLAQSHELLQVTLKSIGDAVITTDAQGAVTWLNAAAQRLTGWSGEQAQGQALESVFDTVDETTRRPMRDATVDCLAGAESRALSPRKLLLARSGAEYAIEGSVSPLHDDRHCMLGSVLVFRDVSEQRRAGREMAHRATHDALTGLVNRSEFETRLSRLLERNDGAPASHAVLFMDLDRFKQVNDTAGHAAGDELLRRLSAMLRESLGTRGTLARLGGDEFAVILQDCAAAHATSLAHALCDGVERFVFHFEGRRFRIGVSIGVVCFDQDWASTDAVVKAADTACYGAKQTGRNRVVVWEDRRAARPERKVEERVFH